MAGAYFRRIRVLGVALLLTVLFLGVITPAYADVYVFILKWGSYGSGDGQFNNPFGVAVDDAGNVYVVDNWNNRVQKFDSSGGFITKWGSGGSGDGQFEAPVGVAVDALGNVYVVDTWNHRVQKFTGSGGFITKWGSEGSGDGQFSQPFGVAVDGSGNVYVADEDNYRVQKFKLGPVYTLTITASAGGTTDPSPGSYEYDTGAVAVVSATHDIGYIFDHWELDGDNVGSTNPINVIMTSDLTLHAVFSWIGTYDLTIHAPMFQGDTNPLPGTHTYPAGEVVSVRAYPFAPYIFDHWELDGNYAGSSLSWSSPRTRVSRSRRLHSCRHIRFPSRLIPHPQKKETKPYDSNCNKPLQGMNSNPRARRTTVREALAQNLTKYELF